MSQDRQLEFCPRFNEFYIQLIAYDIHNLILLSIFVDNEESQTMCLDLQEKRSQEF